MNGVLSDPLAELPRPAGDPARICAGLVAWAAAAGALAAQRRYVTNSASATANTWHGISGAGFRAAANSVGRRFELAAQAIGMARAALSHFAEALRRAQEEWDIAERRIAQDNAAQEQERRRFVLAVERTADQRHAFALRDARRRGLPEPAPPTVPAWRPDEHNSARRGAVALARDSIEEMHRAALQAARALDRARALIWPAERFSAAQLKGWSPFKSLRPGNPGEWSGVMWGPDRTRCVPGGGFYQGSGFIVGPDGLRYALTIPSVATRDGLVTGEINDHGLDTLYGRDPGWRTIHEEFSIADFGDPARGLAKFGWLLALQSPPVNAVPDQLSRLRIGPSGWPWLVARGAKPESALPAPPDNPLDLHRYGDAGPATVPRRVSDAAGGAVWRVHPLGEPPRSAATHSKAIAREALGGAVDLATSVGTSFAATQRVDLRLKRAYAIKFEENGDGRRRALLRTYMLTDYNNPQLLLTARNVSVGPDAKLLESSIAWRSEGPLLLGNNKDYVLDQPTGPAR